MYTGKNWPLEPLKDQQKYCKGEYVHVLLMGEQEDTQAIHAILTQLKFIKKFGRPFANVRELVIRRMTGKSPIVHESPFDYASFTIPKERLPLLEAMLQQCPTMLYQVYKDGDSKTNYEMSEETFLASIEEALKARGWQQRGGPFAAVDTWHDMRTGKAAAPLCYERDRWWTKLAHVWKRG